MIHVGQGKDRQHNLEYGLETRSWGFPKETPELAGANPDFAILATGQAPRMKLPQWLEATATLYLCQVRGGFYHARAPHWPDEEAQGQVLYPYRMGIEPLAVVENVALGPDGPLSEEGSDAIRRSGTHRGIGKVVDMDPQPLLALAKIPADWARTRSVPLDKAPAFTAAPVESKKTPKQPPSGQGFSSDPKKRKAVEKHAEDMALEHYTTAGWHVERLGKPYDLRCTRDGEERHVEVKGTTGAPTSVELTINEVLHARNPENTVDLYVVSDIQVDTSMDPYKASGGVPQHHEDWEPAEEDLRPRKYEYRLPQQKM